MSWYIKAIKNYVNFSGRARRKEYWMFVLFNIIFAIAASILDMILFPPSTGGSYYNQYYQVQIFRGLYALFALLPSLAVGVRRLHDQDKSGAWILLAFVPCIGTIWLFVLMCMEGTAGPNKYGDDPKSI